MNKGRFGRSVRLLAGSKYNLIVDAGFAAGVDGRERPGIREGRLHDRGLELAVRPVVERLSRRAFRDRVFRSTFHWMFDRGLISVDDDGLLLTRDAIPGSVLGLNPAHILLVGGDDHAAEPSPTAPYAAARDAISVVHWVA